ncbi:hypothetical protein [Flavobacterium coralii]|uniref:hypothetical protein n=1 Tax=Flavobacterium coralii TaxID=2838017 RepID=UPI0026B94EDE|tara:strand:- start:37602 stop:39185 length:1584 start_codon:yes stop_codon:yes gene_type:complete
MKFLKRLGITLIVVLVLLVAVNYGAAWYIEKKLPETLQSEKDFPYNINYKDADVQLLSGSITITEAYIAPKDTAAASMNRGAYGKIKSIEANHFNLWGILFENRIEVKNVTIDTPEIILYPREKKYNANDDLVQPFKQTIKTESVAVKNGRFRMLDTLHEFTAKADNINFEINNISIDSNTVEKNIPLRYRNYTFSCDSIFYHVNDFYNITATGLNATDSSMTAKGFNLVPLQKRLQFNRMIPVERDQFTISAKSIAIPSTDWGFVNDTLYFHAPEVVLDKVNANIYRGKMVKDDPTIKKLYSQMLRELKFDLKVDKLMLKNSSIVYEEQQSYDRKPGKVSFTSFYASIYNVYSPIRKEKFPETNIDVQCKFMGTAPLKVNWHFNITDKTDAFTIKGHLQNIDASQINTVSGALMNVHTTGNIKDVMFTFHGNRNNAHGSFAIAYNNLKLKVLEKDGKGKRGLLSFLGNLVVKNKSGNSNNETGLKEADDVKTERDKTKSVFNFLWRFVQQGLKQTILPKVVQKVAG